jgi:hypothetical protein
VAIAIAGDSVLSVAIDDTARLTPAGNLHWGEMFCSPVSDSDCCSTAAAAGGFVYNDRLAALGAAPKAVAVNPRNPNCAIAITAKAMVVLDCGAVSATVPLSFPASCISISPDGVSVAVGADDNKVIPAAIHYANCDSPPFLTPTPRHSSPRSVCSL